MKTKGGPSKFGQRKTKSATKERLPLTSRVSLSPDEKLGLFLLRIVKFTKFILFIIEFRI